MQKPLEIIVHEGWSAAARLGTLGLDLDTVLEVVRIGERVRAEATDNDPLTAASVDAYRYRVRALRDSYPQWTVDRPQNVELTVSPDGTRSILTRAGDAGVGIRDADPQPKKELGRGTSALVGSELLLFGPEWLQAQHVTRPEHETWMLLVYASPTVIRAELSLGIETDDAGRVSRWFERIILPELDPNDLSPRPSRMEETDAFAPDVPVTRKRSA